MDYKINLEKYIAEVKRNMSLDARDEIIEKDLLLSLILAEFEKLGIGKELILKGGTLLSRNYLRYHRFSEDLDFVHKDSNQIRQLNRMRREKRIKQFIDYFVLGLEKVSESLNLEFSSNRSDTKFCTVLHGRVVYIFRLYYSENQFIKIEINFVEKIIYPPKLVSIKTLTDFFDSRELLFVLGLKIENFKVLSYPLQEVILEKYRAILTRDELKERDLFDLFLIENSLNVNINEVTNKIRDSSLIKKDIDAIISQKLILLEKSEFFKSEEKIEDLAIVKYHPEKFRGFKESIKPILVKICRAFLNKD